MDTRKSSVKILLLIPFLSILNIGCTSRLELAQKKFFRMDTITEITIIVSNKNEADSCWYSVDSLLKNWEDRFSVEGPFSEVRLLNERKIDLLPVGAQLKEILETALNYGDSLDGGFDLSVLPLKQLWGFGENSNSDSTIPTPEQIQSALGKVDYKKVKIHDDSVQISSALTKIDVGGIAKGFVLREIGKILKTHGINNYLVSSGGDIIVQGKRIDGKPWRVGIQHPRNDGIIGAVDIDSGSVVTSGDYERYRIVGGKRYHHLFDTKTGYCSSKNQSVTIWGPDPVEADIMSTGLFARDSKEILKYVNERPRFECLIVDSSGIVLTSNGWKERVQILEGK